MAHITGTQSSRQTAALTRVGNTPNKAKTHSLAGRNGAIDGPAHPRHAESAQGRSGPRFKLPKFLQNFLKKFSIRSPKAGEGNVADLSKLTHFPRPPDKHPVFARFAANRANKQAPTPTMVDRLKTLIKNREVMHQNAYLNGTDGHRKAYGEHAEALHKLVQNYEGKKKMSKSDQNAALGHLKYIDAICGLENPTDLNKI